VLRFALIIASAVLLSGCSWIGNGGYGSNQRPVGQRMNLELAVGVDPSIDGDVITTDFDNSGTAQLLRTDYGDAYGRGVNYELGVSYEVSNTVEITAALNYSKSKGKTLDVGSVNGVDPITANFDDLETYGGEIGVRKYFRNRTLAHLLSPAVTPYVGASVGIAHVESTGAVLSSAGFAGIGQPAIINAEFYEDSIVPTAQLTIGAEWRATRNFAIGLETGVRYTGGLSDGDGTLVAIGWQEARGNSQNISIPVTLRGRFKF
jgi:hypothetical protein